MTRAIAIPAGLEKLCAIHEAGLFLRWAANALNSRERAALAALAMEMTCSEAAPHVGLTRGGVWMAQQSAFEKMRRRLKVVGITKVEDLLL